MGDNNPDIIDMMRSQKRQRRSGNDSNDIVGGNYGGNLSFLSNATNNNNIISVPTETPRGSNHNNTSNLMSSNFSITARDSGIASNNRSHAIGSHHRQQQQQQREHAPKSPTKSNGCVLSAKNAALASQLAPQQRKRLFDILSLDAASARTVLEAQIKSSSSSSSSSARNITRASTKSGSPSSLSPSSSLGTSQSLRNAAMMGQLTQEQQMQQLQMLQQQQQQLQQQRLQQQQQQQQKLLLQKQLQKQQQQDKEQHEQQLHLQQQAALSQFNDNIFGLGSTNNIQNNRADPMTNLNAQQILSILGGNDMSSNSSLLNISLDTRQQLAQSSQLASLQQQRNTMQIGRNSQSIPGGDFSNPAVAGGVGVNSNLLANLWDFPSENTPSEHSI